MADLGQELATLLGGNHVNWFSFEGRSYKVIPQVERDFRAHEQMLDDYHVRAANGALVPLSTVVRFERAVEPSERLQFQQLNAVVVEGLPAPGVTMGDALEYLEQTARDLLPGHFSWDYAGEARQYTQQGSALSPPFRRAGRHLPRARRPVRELARSADHPDVGAARPRAPWLSSPTATPRSISIPRSGSSP